jgi:hypothetical protein
MALTVPWDDAGGLLGSSTALNQKPSLWGEAGGESDAVE